MQKIKQTQTFKQPTGTTFKNIVWRLWSRIEDSEFPLATKMGDLKKYECVIFFPSSTFENDLS